MSAVDYSIGILAGVLGVLSGYSLLFTEPEWVSPLGLALSMLLIALIGLTFRRRRSG